LRQLGFLVFHCICIFRLNLAKLQRNSTVKQQLTVAAAAAAAAAVQWKSTNKFDLMGSVFLPLLGWRPHRKLCRSGLQRLLSFNIKSSRCASAKCTER